MNSFGLGLLILIWRIFRSIEGAAGDKCPPPPTVEFAKSFAKSYKVGTIVKYECVEGYKRKSGEARNIQCRLNEKGFAQWTTAACTVDPTLRLPPEPEQLTRTEDGSGSLDSPPTTLQPHRKDFCGVIKVPKHSRALWANYTVGQQLQYQCMDGYQARPPISKMSTCQYSGGTIVWSKLSPWCTNDTTSFVEDTTSVKEVITPERGTSNVSDLKDVGSRPSYDTSFATASAVFAIAVASTVVI
ncbi:interleukin-15 receptor subunit alpha isoform X2 [Eublepharis macularius]|uniref:Interleukin-2 receptor subunit alpha n=1 Tax=Eublepharis macularius TaxID=481883 RepID=A0AA97L777_EUBMA|nr:interleukin-15 receptor subunit alpha isoform X2 [Eublepharis macularius]